MTIHKLDLLVYSLILLLVSGCGPGNKKTERPVKANSNYAYEVKRSEAAKAEIDAVWNKEYWENTSSIRLHNFMGERPSHFPQTLVKLRYDAQHVYVIFKVSDRYVKAKAKKRNGKVWQDSCVEFFFSPGPDVARGYFNLETNCKGIFLFGYHLNNRRENGFVSKDDCSKIVIAHSLERNVEKEIAEPLEWTIEYAIPVEILQKYMRVEHPASGTKWRANFYKCADETSHPHWLTWAKVDNEQPNFHLPDFFGTIEFE